MTDLSCVLAGLVRLFFAPVLLFLLNRKKQARLYPALIGFAVSFPALIIGAMIRSGLSQEDLFIYSMSRGLIYGILEEGAAFLMLRHYLTDYDGLLDAVTYGIGRGLLEDLTAGLSCFGLIGAGTAAPEIFWFHLWAAVSGIISFAAVTALMLYGIRTGQPKRFLLLAVCFHTLSNASKTILFDWAMLLDALLMAGLCFAAYRCWRKLGESDELY